MGLSQDGVRLVDLLDPTSQTRLLTVFGGFVGNNGQFFRIVDAQLARFKGGMLAPTDTDQPNPKPYRRILDSFRNALHLHASIARCPRQIIPTTLKQIQR